MGTMPDAKLAKRIGCAVSRVQDKRRHVGIILPHYRVPWTAGEDRLFATLTDTQIARRLGRSRPAVVKRRLRLGISIRFGGNYKPQIIGKQPWPKIVHALK